MTQQFTVKIGDYQIAQGDVKLVTYALGSCVGVCLYDKQKQLGGMAHILLPVCPQRILEVPGIEQRKYADTVLPMLLAELLKRGAEKRRLQAMIAGGAQMFPFGDDKHWRNIGWLNMEAVRSWLAMQQIPLLVEESGGKSARTMRFALQNGLVAVSSAGTEYRSHSVF